MSEHTEVQIIRQDGRPAFAVVPYEHWLEVSGQTEDEVLLPHEVVGYMLNDGLSLIASWRKYKGLSQAELGSRMGGLSQSAIAQIENPDSKPQRRTLEKVAKALGVDIEQLSE